MIEKVLETIVDRVMKVHLLYGSIDVSMFYHSGKLVKYEFNVSETTIINEKNEKEANHE